MTSIKFYPVIDRRSNAIKKGYSLRVHRYSTIDADQLSALVEQDSHIDRARVAYIMSAVAKQIRQLALNGHKVQLGRLGLVGLTCHATGSDTRKALSVRNNVRNLQITFRPSKYITGKMHGLHPELEVFKNGYYGRQVDEHGAVVIDDKTKE